MLTFSEYARYDGLGLAELVRRGDVSPGELMYCALARLAVVNPHINAVVATFAERANDFVPPYDAHAPFNGVPFLIKDLLADYAGTTLGCGSVFASKQKASRQHSALVQRMLGGGLRIFGKTATPELGLMPFTEPVATGITRNPWNLNHTPGGSSGGAAAAVAAGIVPMASAGDGGGSIRIPASSTGLFGLKPSRGRQPVGPTGGDPWFGFAVEHAITRSVRDSAALLDLTAGALPGASFQLPKPATRFVQEASTEPGRLRVAVTLAPVIGRQIHGDCREAVQNTSSRLASLGHDVVEDNPTLDASEFVFHYVRLLAADTAATVRSLEQQVGRRARWSELEPRTRAMARIGVALSADELVESLWAIQKMSREYAQWAQQYDVVVSSVLGAPPLAIGALESTAVQKAQLAMMNLLPLGGIAKKRNFILDNAAPTMDHMGFNLPANTAGLPSMSVPLDWNQDGLPIGSLFTGRYGEEGVLFRLAAQLEAQYPWNNKRPPEIP